jgi:phosphoglycerate dehydrogenase-like enzyme
LSGARALKVLITDYDFPDVELELAIFRDAGVQVTTAQCRTEEQLIEAAKGHDALLVQYAPVNSRVLAALPEVRIASRFGAGFDNINTEDAKKHGVWVANSPDYGMGEVATHALGLALALIRHIAFYDRDVRNGTWHYSSPGRIRRAGDMTLGILGLGRIGKRMAHISRNCFAAVIACDPFIDDGDFPAYVERVGLMDLFVRADVISIHVPLNDQTRGMVGKHLLSSARPGMMLVNTARGAIVNLDHLLAALDEGRLDGAGLDVLPVEPPAADDPIMKHPRVLLTPHAAFYSVEGERELRRKAAQNLVDWARTGRPSYVVVEGRA